LTLTLDALGPDGAYRTRKRVRLRDVSGADIADMCVVPGLFVARTISAQRAVTPLDTAARHTALQTAADIFTDAAIAGLDFDDYVELTCALSGLPAVVGRAGAVTVADALRTATVAIEAARPVGARLDWRAVADTGGSVWARRGEVLAVHAPGNAPGVHGLWPQALALGYRVTVRPSRREPLTAHRLVLALRESGFRAGDVTYLPTEHVVAGDLVRWADYALVYGGRDIVERYATDPTVLTNGPGRCKILVTAEQNWREKLDVIIDSIAALAGMACVNTTAVLYEGDPAELAAAIADRLSAIPDAALPAVDTETARRITQRLRAGAGTATTLLGPGDPTGYAESGRVSLRPAVYLLDHADTRALGIEMPFPCVWVSPWRRRDGLSALRDSLVVNVLSADETLIEQLLAEPSITNVYAGTVPTHFGAAHIPHEGFLADFLMRNKGFIRR